MKAGGDWSLINFACSCPGFALSLPLKQRLRKTQKLEAYSTQSASINTARRKKAKTAKKNTVENCGVRAERDWIYVKQS